MSAVPGEDARPAGLRIRPADPSDLEAIHGIEQASFAHPWSRGQLAKELEHRWSTLLVAETPEGTVVGFAVIWTVYDEIHLLDMAVSPGHRRKGAGRHLLDALLAKARAEGAARVELEVRRSNAAARSLYTRAGFREIGVRPRYYAPEGEDALLMEYVL